MSKDFRCECGHLMIAQHDRAGCLVGRNETNRCACMVQPLVESDAEEAVQEFAQAAMDQLNAFMAVGFVRAEAYGLTKELLLLGGAK